MELVEENVLPECFRFCCGIFAACQCRGNCPEFKLAERFFALSVALLDGCLNGVGTSVSGEVKLARVGVLGIALLLLHILEEFYGIGDLDLYAALKVLLTDGVFHVVSGRTAAAVAVAEGIEERVEVSRLASVLPNAVDLDRVRGIFVLGGEEGHDLGAVHTLPIEIVIGEGFALIVGPEDLLGNEVFYAAFVEDLGESRRITEGIGEPEQFAVDVEYFFIVALTVDELTDERFAACHIGIGLYPHCAVRDPATFLSGSLDAFEQLGVMLADHFVASGLADEEFIIGVFLKQTELCREGTGGLSVGFRERPAPSKVEVRVTDRVEYGSGGAVDGFHVGAECLARFDIGSVSCFSVKLKVNDQGELLQRVADLGSAEGGIVEGFEKLEEGIDVHVKLVRVLVPNAVGAFAERSARAFLQGVDELRALGKYGARVAAAACGCVVVACVGFHHDVKAVACLCVAGQIVVHHVVMVIADPVCAVRTEGLTVDEKGGFTAWVQVHDDSFAVNAFGNDDGAFEPAIFPGFAPCIAGSDGLKISRHCLLGREIFFGFVSGPDDLADRLIQFLLQNVDPVLNTDLPLRMHDIHVCFLLKNILS